MKLLLIFSTLILLACGVHAQCPVANPADSAKYIKAGVWNWSTPELKEAAKQQYFAIFDYMHDKTTPYDNVAFSRFLDRYEFWRTAVELKLATKKDRDDFSNWLVAEARIAGKTK